MKTNIVIVREKKIKLPDSAGLVFFFLLRSYFTFEDAFLFVAFFPLLFSPLLPPLNPTSEGSNKQPVKLKVKNKSKRKKKNKIKKN